MTLNRTILAVWTVTPSYPPQPWRHCPTCAKVQRFASSGRVRLNANGKRLDAWLIYRCLACDQTWNRPILERQPVGRIAPEELDAMQQSAADWVRRHAFDAAALKVHCTDIHHAPDVRIVKRVNEDPCLGWSKIHLRLIAEVPTGVRTDKVLCEGWQISRALLGRLSKAGSLVALPARKNALKKPLQSEVAFCLSSAGLGGDLQRLLLAGLGREVWS